MGSKTAILPVVLVVFLLLPLSIAFGVGAPLVFQTTWGAGSKNAAYGLGADASGNVYVAGTANLNLPPDYIGAQGTIFLLKYDPQGHLLWQRSWIGGGTAGTELGGSVAVDAQGNSFVAATTPVTRQNVCEGLNTLPGILLLKFDNNGNLVWQKTFAGSCRLTPYAIAVGQTGNIFLTALSWQQTGNPQFPSGPSLIKLNPEGNVIWARTVEWGCVCEPRGVTVDGSDNVVMNGDLVAKFDSQGSLIWEENLFVGVPTRTVSTYLSGNAVALDNSENIYTTGNGDIVKLSPSGNVLWAKQWENGSYGAGLMVDSSNNVFLSGGVTSNAGSPPYWPNPFLLKLDQTGSLLGQTVWEGASASNDYGSGFLTLDSHGHAYVSGAVSGRPPFNTHYDSDTMKNASVYAGACSTTGGCGVFPSIPAYSQCACTFWSYPVSSGNITTSIPNGTSTALEGQTNSGGPHDIFLLGYDAAQLSLAPNYLIPELVIVVGVTAAVGAATLFLFHRRHRRMQQPGTQPVEPVKSILPA